MTPAPPPDRYGFRRTRLRTPAEELRMISVDPLATRTFTSNEARAIATELGIDLGALGRDLQR